MVSAVLSPDDDPPIGLGPSFYQDGLDSGTSSNYYTMYVARTVYRHGAWFGMVAVAVFLLFFCALLAGLTVAICGLDPTWLQLRGIAGTPQER